MKNILVNLVFLGLITACGNKKELDTKIVDTINSYEDSLSRMIQNPLTSEQSNDFLHNYISVLEQAVRTAPENPKAATYMDRIHMLSSATRDLKKSLEYGVKIIDDYPDYANRPMVLKSVAYMYDAEVQPRDSINVRKYYTIYLKENPGINIDEKDMIEKRLLMNQIPFEQFLILEQKFSDQ